MESTRAAIFGAGAMGGTLGALIIKSGGIIDLYSRNKRHVSAVRKNGLTQRCDLDGIEWNIDAKDRIFFPEEMQKCCAERGKYHVIFLMTKQRENEKTALFLRDFLADDGIVVTTQNGLPEKQLAEVLGKDRVFGCVCSFGANFLGDGVCVLTSSLLSVKVCFGAYAAHEGRSKEGEKFLLSAKRVKSLLSPVCNVTGGEFYRETENLSGVRYAKLVLNAAFSGLSAATGMTFGEIANNRKGKKIALAAMREAVAVAEAKGVRIDRIQGRDVAALLQKKRGLFGKIKEVVLLAVMPRFVKTHRRSISGMLTDIRRGRKCEIDLITGAVSREGAECGVCTPVCDAITQIVEGIENGLYELTPKNVDFFL